MASARKLRACPMTVRSGGQHSVPTGNCWRPPRGTARRASSRSLAAANRRAGARRPGDGVAFSPDGRLLLRASEDTTVRLFMRRRPEDVQLPHGAVHKAVFSPDGKLLATASADGTARLFDSANGREIARFSHDDEVPSVAFSADGKLLATASYDTAAHLFDVTSGKEIAQFANGGRVFDVAFSPDSKLLATACCGKFARVFDVASRQEVAELEHDGFVLGVAFSPDGKLLATASGGKRPRDGEVRLFDVASQGSCQGAARSHGEQRRLQSGWPAARYLHCPARVFSRLRLARTSLVSMLFEIRQCRASP